MLISKHEASKQESLATARKSVPQTAGRIADHPIDPVFIKRQSRYDLHRNLTPTQMKEKLMICFEAARWAASGGNGQPWRFIYAVQGTKNWDSLLNLLAPGNHKWAKNAGALVVVVSRTTKEHNGKPSKSHSFDTGLAVSNLLIQATQLGLVAHPIGGFDSEKAYKELNIPAEYAVEIVIVIGEAASSEHSTKEFAARDSKPSQRKPLKEITFDGEMPASIISTSKPQSQQSLTPVCTLEK